MKPVVFIVLLFVLFSGCKKSGDKIMPPPGDYFPLTQASNWHYVPDNSNTAFILYGDAKGNTIVNGKTYSLLNYVPANPRFANFMDSTLILKEGNKYYQVITNQQLYFPLDETGYYEFVFMEDKAPVGTAWSNKVVGTFTFSNGSIRMEQDYQGRIYAYYPTFQLDDKHTYSDVVQVTMNMYSQGFEAKNKLVIQNSIVYDKWYARGKGLIKVVDYSSPGFAVKLDSLQLY